MVITKTEIDENIRVAGWAYRSDRCAWELENKHQCMNIPGHGPSGLYCKEHGPMVEEHYLRTKK